MSDTNQPDSAIPEPEFSSQLDLHEFSQKLLECTTLHNKDKRAQVVGILPRQISDRIDQVDNPLSHVFNMVKTCHNFEHGLTQLLEAVYSLEGDSKGWQAVLSYLQRVAPGWKPQFKVQPHPGQLGPLSGDSSADAVRNYNLSGNFPGAIINISSQVSGSGQQTGAVSETPPPQTGPRLKKWVDFPPNPNFQERPGEFAELEKLLGINAQSSIVNRQSSIRLGLVGMVGMGGVGKTQLAAQLAHRYEKHFPGGVYWLTATGDLLAWQKRFAELAAKIGYLPPDDKPDEERTIRRANYFCRYLAEHSDVLLVLDNVEQPGMVVEGLSHLAGCEAKCALLYTSRERYSPGGVELYRVDKLPEAAALKLLLDIPGTPWPALLNEVQAGSQQAEALAARKLCEMINYLPLALTHLRSLLAKGRNLTLGRLVEVIQERGAIAVADGKNPDAATVFATFSLSWVRVKSQEARQLFRLAACFPEADFIPLWLAGLAAGLGESAEIFERLGKACQELYELSLLEELSGEQGRLHPLVRDFGLHVLEQAGQTGRELIEKALERLASSFEDVEGLEKRAIDQDYWRCTEQAYAALDYARQLEEQFQRLYGPSEAAPKLATYRLEKVTRRLDRENYLLTNPELWPGPLPGLFYQQMHNRRVEEGEAMPSAPLRPTRPWLRQLAGVGAEDPALLRILTGHTDTVNSVAFSPDGRTIVTGYGNPHNPDDKTVRLWESGSGKLLRTFEGHTSFVMSVGFSPDGRTIVSSSNDKTVRLWESSSGKLLRTFEGHTDAVNSVAFSPDGRTIVSSSNDKTVRLWESSSGKLLRTFEGHTSFVMSVGFSPDGHTIVSGAWDKTVRLWESSSGKLLHTFEGHTNYVNSVGFSPDGRTIVSGAGDETVRLWESSSGKLLHTFEGHTNDVNSVGFSPDGRTIVSGAVDKTVRLWESSSGKLLHTFEGHTNYVNSVGFSPDGRTIVSSSNDKTVRLWESSGGKLLHTFEGHTSFVMSVGFSPDGRTIVSSSNDKTVRLWESSGGKLLHTFEGHTSFVMSVGFSPDGRTIVSSSNDKTVRLWESSSGKLLRTFEGHTDAVNSVAFSPDGRTIVSSSNDKTVRLWESGSGKLLRTFEGHTNYVMSVGFSPDGRTIVSGAWDKTVRLWESSSGKLLRTFEGHTNYVMSVGFSPDGRTIVSRTGDETVRLWESSGGKLLHTFEGHTNYVNSVGFSPDGRLVISCDRSGEVRLWRAEGQGQLLALYQATYQVMAIHWHASNEIWLADDGGPRRIPYVYKLRLEGF